MERTREEKIKEIMSYVNNNYTYDDYLELTRSAMKWGYKGFCDMTDEEINFQFNEIFDED